MTLGLVSWWLPCVAAGLLACGTDAGGGGGGGGGDDRDGGGAGNGQVGGSGPGGTGGGPGGTTDAGPEPDALPLDVTPPDVFFRSPFDGATVSGVVEVVAEATDDRAVAQVVFSLDGAEQASVAAAPYTWSWDTAGLIPGPYALTATATDAAGNTDAATIEVQVAGACRADGNCPPADVRIITPVDQAVVCGQFNIEAAATDDDLARIEFMVDNRPVGVAERSPFAVVWNTEGFDNGLHTITALAIDSADQRAFARVEVEVRNEPGVVCRQAPNINIVQPADGAFLNGQVPLEADASDDGVVVSVEFSVDNGRLDVVESVPWRSTWDTALFDEGAHTVKAKATDDTNDTATTQVQVTVDRTAPTVEVLTPSIGETFADRVPFALDVADNFAIDHVEVRLGGPDGQVLATLNVGPWEGELDTSAVASGDHELSAVVHDKVGLTSTASVDIRLDRAPMVSFVAPAAGATLEGPTTVEVSADDDLGVQSIELYVDDQLLDERAGQRFAEFRWEPPYRRGEHTLRAVATDSGGQTAEASLRVMVDHPFEVTITSPTDAQTVADTVTVNAETRDDDGQTQRVEFFVDGNLVGTDVTAPYEVDVDTTALPDGDRRLRARALSDNGQEADATVTVRVNNCDRDDDGYLGCGGADCDDRAFNVNPDAADRVGDGADQNCDDLDGVDDDGDGVASIGSGGGDCDDGDPLVVPGATDPVGDGVDQNCDRIDGVDADGDGYASIQSGGDDCSDADSAIHSNAREILNNGIDEDCHGGDLTGCDEDSDCDHFCMGYDAEIPVGGRCVDCFLSADCPAQRPWCTVDQACTADPRGPISCARDADCPGRGSVCAHQPDQGNGVCDPVDLDPLPQQGEWGPSARVTHYEIPVNAQEAAALSCDLPGPANGSSFGVFEGLSGVPLTTIVEPNNDGVVPRVILGLIHGWAPGQTVEQASPLELAIVDGIQHPADQWTIAGDALGQDGVFFQTFHDVEVSFDGSFSSEVGRVLVPLPLITLGSAKPLEHATISGQFAVDGAGFAIGGGLIQGYHTRASLVQGIRQEMARCGALERPSDCGFVDILLPPGSCDGDCTVALSILQNLLGPFDARVTPAGVEHCDPGIANDCNAHGVCISFAMEGIAIDGIEGGGPPACVPDCAGVVCGGDGCGGSCGDCGALSIRSAQDTDDELFVELSVADRLIRGDSRSPCELTVDVGGDDVPLGQGDRVFMAVFGNEDGGEDRYLWSGDFNVTAEEIAAQHVQRTFDCTGDFGVDGEGSIRVYAGASTLKLACQLLCRQDSVDTAPMILTEIGDDALEDDDSSNRATPLPAAEANLVAADLDWRSFDVQSPSRIEVRVDYLAEAGPLDVRLFREDGASFEGQDEGDATLVDVAAAQPGLWYVAVAPRDLFDYNLYRIAVTVTPL